ncbi:MAG: hypothetical protein H7175_23480, partial [Burkholderiales bacterium]|nr:hypothetical protein [Anaerolineae bacterium]
ILAIGVLVVLLKATGHIGQAFDFGAARGMVAWGFGLVIASIIMGTIGMVVTSFV